MNGKAILLALLASTASIPSAQAGFLDFLFGRRTVTPAAQPAQPLPELTVTIRKPRPKAANRPPKLVYVSPAEMLARTIDPVKTPDWHLIDPTLKKGDVIVLPGRVLVFAGGRIGDEVNYVPLEKTRLLDKGLRTQIALMTGRAYDPPMLTANAAPRRLRVLGAN